MSYDASQPEESGFYWVRASSGNTAPDEFVVEVDAATGEVRDPGRWIDLSVFESQWDVVEWSEPLEQAD